MTIESKLFRLNRHLNALAQTSRLSTARMEVLRLIKENNPITLRKLSDIQQVRMPTMSKLVDELQQESLVIRAQSKEDARQRWIVPTQKGIQVLSQAQQQSHQQWQQLLKGLSNQQVKRVEDSLQLLLDQLADSPR